MGNLPNAGTIKEQEEWLLEDIAKLENDMSQTNYFSLVFSIQGFDKLTKKWKYDKRMKNTAYKRAMDLRLEYVQNLRNVQN